MMSHHHKTSLYNNFNNSDVYFNQTISLFRLKKHINQRMMIQIYHKSVNHILKMLCYSLSFPRHINCSFKKAEYFNYESPGTV